MESAQYLNVARSTCMLMNSMLGFPPYCMLVVSGVLLAPVLGQATVFVLVQQLPPQRFRFFVHASPYMLLKQQLGP